jgi:hypothetical protein
MVLRKLDEPIIASSAPWITPVSWCSGLGHAKLRRSKFCRSEGDSCFLPALPVEINRLLALLPPARLSLATQPIDTFIDNNQTGTIPIVVKFSD